MGRQKLPRCKTVPELFPQVRACGYGRVELDERAIGKTGTGKRVRLARRFGAEGESLKKVGR
jgi:hypothetical protein